MESFLTNSFERITDLVSSTKHVESLFRAGSIDEQTYLHIMKNHVNGINAITVEQFDYIKSTRREKFNSSADKR